MKGDNMEQAIDLIQKLAQTLSPATKHLWAVLVKQAVLTSIASLILSLQLLILGFILAPRIKRFFKKLEAFNGDASPTLLFYTVATIFVLLMVYVGASAAITLLNPEFWALEQILDRIG